MGKAFYFPDAVEVDESYSVEFAKGNAVGKLREHAGSRTFEARGGCGHGLACGARLGCRMRCPWTPLSGPLHTSGISDHAEHVCAWTCGR